MVSCHGGPEGPLASRGEAQRITKYWCVLSPPRDIHLETDRVSWWMPSGGTGIWIGLAWLVARVYCDSLDCDGLHLGTVFVCYYAHQRQPGSGTYALFGERVEDIDWSTLMQVNFFVGATGLGQLGRIM